MAKSVSEAVSPTNGGMFVLKSGLIFRTERVEKAKVVKVHNCMKK